MGNDFHNYHSGVGDFLFMSVPPLQNTPKNKNQELFPYKLYRMGNSCCYLFLIYYEDDSIICAVS